MARHGSPRDLRRPVESSEIDAESNVLSSSQMLSAEVTAASCFNVPQTAPIIALRALQKSDSPRMGRRVMAKCVERAQSQTRLAATIEGCQD